MRESSFWSASMLLRSGASVRRWICSSAPPPRAPPLLLWHVPLVRGRRERLLETLEAKHRGDEFRVLWRLRSGGALALERATERPGHGRQLGQLRLERFDLRVFFRIRAGRLSHQLVELLQGGQLCLQLFQLLQRRRGRHYNPPTLRATKGLFCSAAGS